MVSLAWTTALLVMVPLICSELQCPDFCPDHYDPVCGSDQVTYDNDCRLRSVACTNRQLKKVHDGPCVIKTQCLELCFATFDPVCGTDGKTYINSCYLEAETCKNPHLNLRVDFNGQCEEKIQCPEICYALHDPVCGTDGKTYSNSCYLRVEACKNPHLKLSVDYNGECKKIQCPEICYALHDPVCGTDGKTYSNSCYLEVEACKNPHLNLTVDYKGECSLFPRLPCVDLCYPLYVPVCGTDGRTYINSCFLGVEACKNSDVNLRVDYNGKCGKL
ncbi:four-domain proteases inhibitor [Cherax quadricarinatus]|uniref:four-domain proteases inhibitor n=1 Tax=Cherax quadricarinatus TaxID=27406 RepID=UPI00387EA1CD